MKVMSEYNDMACAHALVKLIVGTMDLSEEIIKGFCSNGIEINSSMIPSSIRLSHGINRFAQALCSPTRLEEVIDFTSDSAKIDVMTNAAKDGKQSIHNRGDATSLASMFSISRTYASKILKCIDEGTIANLYVKSRKSGGVEQSQWPELIKVFCLTKPVCREVPGETVSIGYGKRAEKYIRQFSIEEIFQLFCLKYKDFPSKLTTFRRFVPKNLVSPSLRDIKRNTCPLHGNLKRSAAALNRFFIKQKAKDLVISSSTIDLCLLGICQPKDTAAIRNPLSWNMKCTKGNCEKCGFDSFIDAIKNSIIERKLSKKKITFSQWVKEYEEKPGKKKIGKVVLRKMTLNIEDFLCNVFMESLSSKSVRFPEHLWKSWTQWEITKRASYSAGKKMTLPYVPVRTTKRT